MRIVEIKKLCGCHSFRWYFSILAATLLGTLIGTGQNVLAQAAGSVNVILFEDFSDGTLPTDEGGWSYREGGKIELVNGGVRMTDTAHYGAYSLNEMVVRVDVSGANEVILTFDHEDLKDEENSLPSTFDIPTNGDGVSVSSNGVTWYTVLTWATPWGTDTSGTFRIPLAETVHDPDNPDLEFTENFYIKFQQYDNYAAPYDGRIFDNIKVEIVAPTCAPGDNEGVDCACDPMFRPNPIHADGVLIDDFSDKARYETNQQNALGLVTDDDNTMRSPDGTQGDTVEGEMLTLMGNGTYSYWLIPGYWFTVLGDSSDIFSQYSAIRVRARGKSGGEQLDMGVRIFNSQDQYKSQWFGYEMTLSTTFSDYNFSLGEECTGEVSPGTASFLLTHLSPVDATIEIDEIEFVR